jgi:group I intron endonuclease
LSSSTKRANNRLRNSWKKHGESAFKFSILELCPVDKLTEREEFWLNHYLKLYPLDVANAKGPVDNPMRGSKHRPETLQKISQVLKGRKKSEEHKAKIGAANKGHVKSVQTCEAISAGKKGKANPRWVGSGNPAHSQKYKERFNGENNPAKRPEVRAKMSKNNASKRGVIDVQSGQVWETMSACAEELGVSVTAVHAAATKKNPSVKGRVLERWFGLNVCETINEKVQGETIQ